MIRSNQSKTPGPDDIPALRERTLRMSIWDVVAWSVMSGFGDLYVAPFAIFLHAGNSAVAFIGISPFLVGALAQLLGAFLTDRHHVRKPIILGFVFLQALLFLPLFFIPLFFRGTAVGAVLICWSLLLVCAHAATPPWLSMMGDVVPANRRGDYFGRRSRISVLIVMAASLVAGAILAVTQKGGLLWLGYGILFVTAFVARLVSARLVMSHYDPHYAPPKESFFTFLDFIRQARHSNFTRFAFLNALMLGAINVASPFFAIYMLRDLHWTYTQFTISTAVFMLTQFLVIHWWGRMGDRFGNRLVVLCSSFLLPLVPLPWVFTTNFYWLLAGQMLSGISWSGYTIATQNFTMDAVSSYKRARVTSYMTILNGAFTWLGGMMIGAMLANRLPASLSIGTLQIVFLSSLPFLFILSAMLRFLAAVLMAYSIQQVRPVEKISTQMAVLRVPGGRAVAGFLSASAGVWAEKKERDRKKAAEKRQ